MTISAYNIIVGISALIVIAVPFTGDVFVKANKTWRKVTWRGWVIVFASLIGIWASVKKDNQSSLDEEDSEAQFKKELAERDTRFQIEFKKQDAEDKMALKAMDSLDEVKEMGLEQFYVNKLTENGTKSLRTYTTALAKYNLQYSLEQDRVVKMIRDSASRPLNLPFIDMCSYPICRQPIGIDSDADGHPRLYFKYKNYGNTPAFEVSLTSILLFVIQGRFSFYSKDEINNSELGSNVIRTVKEDLPPFPVDTVACYIFGTYKNSDGKLFRFKQAYIYGAKRNAYTREGSDEEGSVNFFLRHNGYIQ